MRQDRYDFDEDGGHLLVGGQVLAYTYVDIDDGAIELAAPSPVAVAADERVDACLPTGEVVVEADLVNQRVAPCPIETRVAASVWGDDGLRITTETGIEQPDCFTWPAFQGGVRGALLSQDQHDTSAAFA